MSQNKREDVIIVCVVNQIYIYGLTPMEDIALPSIPSLLARPEALTARANAGDQGHP